MDIAERTLEAAVWAAAEGTATAEQLTLLEADARGWRRTLERLLDETEEALESVQQSTRDERDQALADIEGELDRLHAAYDLLVRDPS
ncbi:MAG TPA: hypothetical protein VEA78_00005, partial [Acidimicrobiales bacterium]|nr:hypothetical protein [Acidimicrobiales bacterium]